VSDNGDSLESGGKEGAADKMSSSPNGDKKWCALNCLVVLFSGVSACLVMLFERCVRCFSFKNIYLHYIYTYIQSRLNI
jgi:hypothetical protein